MNFETHVRCPHCGKMLYVVAQIDIWSGDTEGLDRITCKRCKRDFWLKSWLEAQATAEAIVDSENL